jgi:integrase/recombinase XerD
VSAAPPPGAPSPAPDAVSEAGPVPLSRDGEEFLTWLAVEQGRSRNTIAAYRRDLLTYEAFLRARGTDLDGVDAALVEEHLADRRAGGIGPRSLARALAAVRGLHRFRLEEGWDSADPTADVHPPQAPSRLPKALGEPEVLALLEAAAGPSPFDRRDLAILEVLYGTGMRVSELVGLGLGDLGSDTGLVRVLGKGSKERLVPLGRCATAALERWLAPGGRDALEPRRWARRADADAVFLNARGGRLTRQGVWGVIEKRAARAGLAGRVHPHVLRHSCASHMLAHGADIRVVQELLGHASVATTQVYTRVSPEHLRRAYEQAHPRAVGREGH